MGLDNSFLQNKLLYKIEFQHDSQKLPALGSKVEHQNLVEYNGLNMSVICKSNLLILSNDPPQNRVRVRCCARHSTAPSWHCET